MKSRDIQTRFWTDEFISDCSFEAKSVYLYLLTCPYINISGIFQLTKKRIEFDLSISRERLDKALTELQESGKVYWYDGWVWVFNAKKNNFSKYLASSKNHDSFLSELEQIPDNTLVQMFNLARQNHIGFDDFSFKQPDTCIYTSINTSINRSMYSTHNHNHNNNQNNNNFGKFENLLPHDEWAGKTTLLVNGKETPIAGLEIEDMFSHIRRNPQFHEKLLAYGLTYDPNDMFNLLDKVQKINRQKEEEQQKLEKEKSNPVWDAFVAQYKKNHPTNQT